MRPVSHEYALSRILELVQPVRTVGLPLGCALDHVLSGPVVAPLDLPPFDSSAMDGYAVRSDDAVRGGALLLVVGEARAGHPARVRIDAGTAVRIMTGGALPAGADRSCPRRR